jgi:energy-coupling factor transporter ATP-binding protein EcfA2
MVAYMASNPFATRFTRPGRIEPFDHQGNRIDVDALLERLHLLGGTAAIVGPHGSGKSTLLVHLADAIDRRGEHVHRVRLHSWRDAFAAWKAIRRAPARGTVCIDSWECLGVASRTALLLAARLTGRGLLVTAHRGADMPQLVHCGTTATLLRSIVRTLPGRDGWHGTWILDSDVESAFAAHGGNLRESLYELYDRFEVRAREARAVRADGPDAGDGCAGGSQEIHEFAGGFSYAGAPERNLG